LPGIVQTQTDSKKGYTFLEGLRSALRQDPDVIMVGEIRDSETAEIAVNAALTGHLVFSTLHTNNAAGTFPRLIDLGVNPKVITSALSVSMAQRLVRRLCPNCKKEVPIEGTDKRNCRSRVGTVLKTKKNIFETIPNKIFEPKVVPNVISPATKAVLVFLKQFYEAKRLNRPFKKIQANAKFGKQPKIKAF
jgi:type II secretory ATPase GspE/PulE/Tfp pilus assembly ATPase PilB-like protein